MGGLNYRSASYGRRKNDNSGHRWPDFQTVARYVHLIRAQCLISMQSDPMAELRASGLKPGW